MNVCDLFVFPSLYETGPQVVLEAKSCGALCVVSPNGGGRKIRHNFDGIIISKYLINEWVKVIYSLLKEKKKFQKLKIIYKNIIPVHHGGIFFLTCFIKIGKKF